MVFAGYIYAMFSKEKQELKRKVKGKL
jgi:hypothetical protein